MPERFKDQMVKGLRPGQLDAIRMAISVRDSADAEIKQLKRKSHVARAEAASLRASLKLKGTDYPPLTDKDCANIATWAMQADEKPRKMTPEELAECESAYMRFVQNEDPPDGLFLAYHHPSYIEHIRIVERERDEALELAFRQKMTLQDAVTHIIVDQLDVSSRDVRPESRLREDFDCDSLDLAEVVMSLEDEFEFTLLDESVLCTVKDCMDAVDAGATLRTWKSG